MTLMKSLVILNFAAGEVIFAKIASTEDESDVEDYIAETLGLSLNSVEWMIADEIKVTL